MPPCFRRYEEDTKKIRRYEDRIDLKRPEHIKEVSPDARNQKISEKNEQKPQ